jgi:hypothetical protein
MSDELPVTIRNLLPGPGNWGIFLGTEGQDKVIAIFVDPTMAAAMLMALRKIQAPRPLTHELIARIFTGLGIRALKVVISDLDEGTYFARLYLQQASGPDRNVVEIDARPSDSIAIAIQQQCPLYVARHVWDAADDMSDLLRQAEQRARERQDEGDDSPPDTPENGP